MKTDKELLQLAAKAVGLRWLHERAGKLCYTMQYGGSAMRNPLEDDGDALRLAVDLDMDVCLSQKDKQVTAFTLSYGAVSSYTEPYGNDKHAATRRAIVRAAAAIGEGMG